MREEYAIYLRKSRADAQAEICGEGETLARHEAALRELARRQGLAVACVHRELVSGESLAARPVMRRLLADVERGRWAGVLVMDIDRLARGDTVDQGIVAQAFRYSGTKIFTPTKTYAPDNEFDEEFFEFGLFMSRREYKLITRRLQRGRLASVREGKYVGSGQPYGYRRVKLEKEKGFTLEPAESEAGVVRMLFEWYAAGIGGARPGTPAIAERLNGLGVPSPKQGRWTAGTVRDILQNPVYIGLIRWNWRPVVRRVSGGQRYSSRPRSEEYQTAQGRHPAIVEEDLWREAQRLMRQNAVPRAKRGAGVKNPLAGLVICGECGQKMIRKPYRGNTKDALLCATRGCSTASSVLEAVEEQVVASLARWLEGYRVEPESAAPSRAKTALLGRLRADEATVARQKAGLHDLLEQGVYDAQTFRARAGQTDARLHALRESIAALEAELAPAGEEQDARPAGATVTEIYERAATAAGRNQLLKALLQKIVYFRAKGGRWHGEGVTLHLYPRLMGASPPS